jgi:hypothetical protein
VLPDKRSCWCSAFNLRSGDVLVEPFPCTVAALLLVALMFEVFAIDYFVILPSPFVYFLHSWAGRTGELLPLRPLRFIFLPQFILMICGKFARTWPDFYSVHALHLVEIIHEMLGL